MRFEPILLRKKRHNFFPHQFVHRGVEQRVRRVDRTWEIGASRWRRAGRVYRVVCQTNASYDVFHDVALNAWFVRQRPLQTLNIVLGKALGKGNYHGLLPGLVRR